MTTAVKARALEPHKVKLKDMAPPPLNNGFETKETHADAIKKRDERLNKVVHDVPPTNPGKYVKNNIIP